MLLPHIPRHGCIATPLGATRPTPSLGVSAGTISPPPGGEITNVPGQGRPFTFRACQADALSPRTVNVGLNPSFGGMDERLSSSFWDSPLGENRRNC